MRNNKLKKQLADFENTPIQFLSRIELDGFKEILDAVRKRDFNALKITPDNSKIAMLRQHQNYYDQLTDRFNILNFALPIIATTSTSSFSILLPDVITRILTFLTFPDICKTFGVSTVWGYGRYFENYPQSDAVRLELEWKETVKKNKLPRDLNGHSSSVHACAISPDGKFIVSGSSDNTIKIWDAAKAECILTLQGHTRLVHACAISPDGKFIVSGSFDNTIKIWDVAKAKCIRTLQGHSDWVLACAISPDGKLIVSGSSDKTIKIWDAETGACILTLKGHSSCVRACVFSPDQKFIVSGSSDDTIKIWPLIEILGLMHKPFEEVTAPVPPDLQI